MTPTRQLKLKLLKELAIENDLQRLCLTWDIPLDIADSYGLLSPSSQRQESESTLNRTPRTHHRIGQFG
jgi:hypothetical protein